MSKYVLKLRKAEDEDERDEIYDGIYQVAEVCSYLSSDMVIRYNNYERLVKMLYEAKEQLRAVGYHYGKKIIDEKADKIESLLLEIEVEKRSEL